jgi:uncharacterized protein (TIGR00251 family)
MQHHWCQTLPQGLRIAVQIQANAKKTEVIGIHDQALKLKLHAQPIEGKANDALIRFLSASLHIPRSCIVLTHGQTNKKKIIEIKSEQLTEADLIALLQIPQGAS